LPELARVDALVDDATFFAPFAPYFHPAPVRPTAPVECYLRLMFLKFRYRLGYESLCAEVSGSISWRRFCRIGLGVSGVVNAPARGAAALLGQDRGDRPVVVLLCKPQLAGPLRGHELRP
jgi:transposase, IS5 family